MQSLCLRHTYLCSHLFAIPPTCFPWIVVPSLPPPCPCRIHTLRRGGVVGLHQGVCPSPPPGMPQGCLSHPPPLGMPPGCLSQPPPPGMPPGCLSHHAPPRAASAIAPFDAPLPPVDAVICVAAPPPPPTALAHTLFSVPGGRWHLPLAPHNHQFVAANNWRAQPSTRLRAH